MPGRDFLFGFKFLATDYVSPILKNIETRMEAVNRQVKATANWREYAGNAAMIGTGAIAIGGAVGLVLKGMVGSAAEMDEHWQHLSTALDSGAAGVSEMAQAHKLVAALAVKFNYSQKEIVDNLYKSMSYTGDWNSALAVTTNSLAVAKGNLGDASTIGQSLSIMLNDWPGKVGHTNEQMQYLADLVAYTSRHGAFSSVNELMSGMSVAIGSVKAAGLGPEDAMAMLQAYSRVGMVGPEAGTALMETLQAFSKGKLQSQLGVALAVTKAGGLDLIGTLVNLRKEYGSGIITVEQYKRATSALGIRGERALAVNVDDLLKFRNALNDPSLVKGAAMAGATTMMGAFSEKMGVVSQKWDILKETLGKKLLGPIESIGIAMGGVLDAMIAFANWAPGFTKFAMVAAGVASAVLLIGGGLALASAGLMGFASFIPAVIKFAQVTRLCALATKAWTAAQWLLNAAMDANPIALAIIAAAALAVAAYEVYEHWATVKAFFMDWGSWAYTAGANLVKAIAGGIWSAITFPQHAMEAVVTKIRAYLPFSPAHEGPLRNLNRMRLVETMADTIRPGPALAAIRRTATAIAIAAPMTIGPAIGLPAMARASGGAGGGIVIQIKQEIHIDGAVAGDAQKLLTTLRQHGEELADIIDRRLAHRARREF